MFRKVSLTALSLIMSSACFAQFNAGGGIALNKYGGDYGKMHPALQLRAGYDFESGKFVYGGINFSPVKGKTDFTTYATNGSGTADVGVTQKVGFNNLFLHFGKAFGDQENAFRFKIFAGVSLDLISIKYEMGDVPAGYSAEEIPNAKASGAKLDFGIGGDFRVGPGQIFVEGVAGLPANKMNDQPYANPTVGHLGVSIGYKYTFGGDSYY